MDKHEQLMEQFNRLYGRMLTSYGAKCACDVTEKQWKNATERFARGAKREELVGFCQYRRGKVAYRSKR